MDTKTNGNAIDPSDKLGDIVTNNPSLAIELEKRGLDYCCQGARTLSDAAKEAGIEPQTLADESLSLIGLGNSAGNASYRTISDDLLLSRTYCSRYHRCAMLVYGCACSQL